MLVEARSELSPARALPGGLAFEQKPDGYRASFPLGPAAVRTSGPTTVPTCLPGRAADG
ncbi:hypothetical protein LUX34_01710 [Streptomyces werraensis]|uniref:hypothetical protein n=1 Tax=Streptomyces werraensis TaxID=68284 RepID=UPI003428EC37|nr:hypothetical protein [Streptomyces werraensis]